MVKVYFRTVTDNRQTHGKGYFVYGNSQRANDQEIVYHTDLTEFVYTDPDTEIDLGKGARGTLHFVIGGSSANAIPARSVFNIEMAGPVRDLRTTAKDGSQSCRPNQLGLTNKPGIWLEWPSIGGAVPSWWEGRPDGGQPEPSPQPDGGDATPQPPQQQPNWPFPLPSDNGDLAKLLIFLYGLGKRDFPSSYLPEIDFSKADLRFVDLSFSYLCAANFGAANLAAANLGYAYLGHAYLGYAYLGYAYLGYAYLCRADLSCANLTEADLSFADLCQAKLGAANLTAANLGYADLCQAYLGHAYLGYAYLGYADLCGADLSHANLTEANLSCADLCQAKLIEVNLTGANLTGADFGGADLTGADLRGANITGANFVGANLTGVLLDDTQKPLLKIA